MIMRAKWAVVLTSAALSMVLMTQAARGEKSAESRRVEQRLRRIEDHDAIEKLLITYGRFLDKEDLVGYSDLFAKDGVWAGGIGSAKGPRQIREMLQTVLARTTPGQYGNAYHIMSDIIIDVDGDTAKSWSRWTWIVEAEDGRPVPQRSGHYEDTLVRENGQWKFQYRLTVTELPTAAKDAESAIWRKDHRSKD
jgi:hypothetical protein